MFFYVLVLITSVVAGYYASETYSKHYYQIHQHSRLYSLIIFIVVMALTQAFLNRIF